jgi:hypothetical protein
MAVILPHKLYELRGIERVLLKDQSVVLVYTDARHSYLDVCLEAKAKFVAWAKHSIQTRNFFYFRHCWGQARYWANQYEAYLAFFAWKGGCDGHASGES